MRSFFKKNLAFIISLAFVFGFISCLSVGIALGVGLSNTPDKNDHSSNTSSIVTEVETDSKKESVASLGAVLIETDDTTATESVDLSVPTISEDEHQTENEGSFWVEYIDVGQGDSALIQCDGHYMLIDGGAPSASSIVYTVLKNKGIDKLDYMIATHPDADHIGGLSGALNYATVGVCYSPVTSHDTKTFESLVKYLNKQNVSITVPSAGTKFQLGIANVEILGPILESEDTNNNSIVTRITYGETSFLFMGDAEYEEENSLIEAGVDLSCDVLKAGHHGSSSSTSKEFLRKAAPKYVVLSVGSENSYGHPTEKTLSKLKAFKLSLFRTDVQGDIICVSDGKSISFATEKNSSEEALWIAGQSSDSSETKEGNVVASSENSVIPEGTTYVLNTRSKRFHLVTCESVNDIVEKNKAYSTETAEDLIVAGYKPCGRCNPYNTHIHKDDSNTDQSNSSKDNKDGSEKPVYVLNTKKMNFHKSDCKKVKDIKAKYRKTVTMTRKKIIKKGYKPCKSCNP